MCVQYPQSGALETLRLASARPVSGGKSRGKVSALFRLPPFRREHAPGSFGLRLGLCAAKRSTTALPPAPTAPVPLSSRAAASLHPRTPRTRPGDRGESRGGSAAGAALRAPNSSCCTVRHKTARAHRSPLARASALARTLPRRQRRGPREPPRPHCELRRALHTARARPAEIRTPHLRRPCPCAAPYPGIAPGRMGRDWPMADQSAVRRTADAQRGNAPQPPRAVRGGRQHPSRADREGHTGGREVRRGLAW